jgi:DNA-binding MarR family transcriptional regulator
VDHRGSRLTQLAASAQTTKQTAGFLVDQLQEAGYVERVPDARDGRARLIRVTPRGYEVIAVASTEQTKIESEWTRHLGTQAVAELRQTLIQLREITDPYA